jgi:hypothetical protein
MLSPPPKTTFCCRAPSGRTLTPAPRTNRATTGPVSWRLAGFQSLRARRACDDTGYWRARLRLFVRQPGHPAPLQLLPQRPIGFRLGVDEVFGISSRNSFRKARWARASTTRRSAPFHSDSRMAVLETQLTTNPHREVCRRCPRASSGRRLPHAPAPPARDRVPRPASGIGREQR